MSLRCDACQDRLDEDDGCAQVLIRDPMPDFSAGITSGLPRHPPRLDLCSVCLSKMITALGLPADTFRPRPVAPPPAPPAGALSDADLAELGLKET